MCQQRKHLYTCGQPVDTTTWEPENAENCPDARDANERDFLGNLKRCSDMTFSTATFTTRSHCGAHYGQIK